MGTFKEKLQKWNACQGALDWLGDRSEQQALAECDRGDWLLWWFSREIGNEGYPDHRRFTLAKARCAKLVVHLMKDERSIKAVEVAESYGNGVATRKELIDASNAANAANAAADDDDAYAAAAAAAAYTAAAATAAYAAAANAADDDAYVAAAAAAYAAAAADAVKKDMLKQCADICRELFFLPERR
jgi:hypothetical protein